MTKLKTSACKAPKINGFHQETTLSHASHLENTIHRGGLVDMISTQ
jgi:hypothetical protein